MDYETSQRRRTFIAIALTLVLAPAAFLLTRGDDETASAPEITVIGTTPIGGTGGAEDTDDVAEAPASAGTDVMGTSPVEVLVGDETGAGGDPATIAIPRPPQGVTGDATFSRSIGSVEHCLVGAPGVPFDALVTVTNLDNSMQIACLNSIGGARPEEAIVLHADAFLQIADLTEAPVPVQITW